MTPLWGWGLLVVSGVGLLMARRAVQVTLALGLQYAAAGWLIMQMWPPRMALVKVVSGWAAALILFLASRRTARDETMHIGLGGGAFRFFTGILALLAVISLLPAIDDVVPGITPLVLGSAVWLLVGALLQLGFTLHPLHTAAGWLTLSTGFEILYAAVERSTLITLVLAVLHLALALAGAYLLSDFSPESDE